MLEMPWQPPATGESQSRSPEAELSCVSATASSANNSSTRVATRRGVGFEASGLNAALRAQGLDPSRIRNETNNALDAGREKTNPRSRRRWGAGFAGRASAWSAAYQRPNGPGTVISDPHDVSSVDGSNPAICGDRGIWPFGQDSCVLPFALDWCAAFVSSSRSPACFFPSCGEGPDGVQSGVRIVPTTPHTAGMNP